MGLLPELTSCIVCGATLEGRAQHNGSGRAYYHALADGLMCIQHKRLASSEMTNESRLLAAEMFHSPVDSFAQAPWPRARAADLRKFLVQSIERHIEKKLVTAVALGKLD